MYAVYRPVYNDTTQLDYKRALCSDIRSESRFCLPHLHSTPPLEVGGFPSEYRHPVWHGKTVGLATRWRKKLEVIFIRFGATHERDRRTDRQTDGRTPHAGNSRAYA